MKALSRLSLFALIALGGSHAHAAPDTKPTAAGESSQVKPAAERAISAGAAVKPTGTGHADASHPAGTSPVIRGPRIPEEMRVQMKAMLDDRIDGNLRQIKTLRGEAVTLLSTFVAESPRESPEMPEAMMRLGELRWELERDTYVDRFKAWEARPVDQRGVAPEPNFAPSRDLFGRVMRDYPWFGQMDLVLYVDGFLATEQGNR